MALLVVEDKLKPLGQSHHTLSMSAALSPRDQGSRPTDTHSSSSTNLCRKVEQILKAREVIKKLLFGGIVRNDMTGDAATSYIESDHKANNAS